ncbi:hypothetical protein E2C01_092254 [Portunus trituberculatus]|uniref:Uncharacterized protein n=1 Tax=Portunus trituberculatus TaxID=210409 RepID=A0A5B7JQ33_PORTR|nr:hypothetical protein [Portunus trituberculatus]
MPPHPTLISDSIHHQITSLLYHIISLFIFHAYSVHLSPFHVPFTFIRSLLQEGRKAGNVSRREEGKGEDNRSAVELSITLQEGGDGGGGGIGGGGDGLSGGAGMAVVVVLERKRGRKQASSAGIDEVK